MIKLSLMVEKIMRIIRSIFNCKTMITKLVLTEEDGSTTTTDNSSPLTSVVATMDDGTEVTLFPGTTPPGTEPVISVPLNTPIRIIAG